MEKKTIGKFIAVLRKANGMTQKELGEKLFVSDKTVSRWECDECTPELSLIPSIAEIFGITTDELLRGERNNPDNNANTEHKNVKSDKQFKLMFYMKKQKYKNLTLISIGITILGFIAAMIANLAFAKGLIAFFLATAFGVVSEICQICFAINARIMIDDDEDTYTDRIEELNTYIVKTAVKISFINIILLASCLPLAIMIDGANFGLSLNSFIVFSALFTSVILAISYIVYTLFVCKILCNRRLIVLSEQQKSEIQCNNKLLKKIIAVSVCIALIIGIGILILNNNIGIYGFTKEMKFDNCDDFKTFVENDYERWLSEGGSYIDSDGNVNIKIPIEIVDSDREKVEDDQFPNKVYEKIINSEGEVICEYYYNPDLYKYISFTGPADNKMPVTIITYQSYYEAERTFRIIESTLYFLIVFDFVIAAGIYLIMINKRRKTV